MGVRWVGCLVACGHLGGLFGRQIRVHLLGLIGEGMLRDDVGGIGAAQLQELVL